MSEQLGETNKDRRLQANGHSLRGETYHSSGYQYPKLQQIGRTDGPIGNKDGLTDRSMDGQTNGYKVERNDLQMDTLFTNWCWTHGQRSFHFFS